MGESTHQARRDLCSLIGIESKFEKKVGANFEKIAKVYFCDIHTAIETE